VAVQLPVVRRIRPASKRHRAIVAAAVTSLCGSACRSAPPAEAPGTSLGTPSFGTPRAERTARKPAVNEPLEWFAAATTWPMAGPPFRSLGHYGGKYRGVVRVLPEGLDAYRTGRPSALAGARIALFLDDDGERGPVLAMERTDQGWIFRSLTPDGRPEDEAASALCERCHAEAPRDHTFGLPQSR